ncbi:hypothetical protein EST62_02350 [Chlorobaculum sp. 24CR]|uniref:hypothetical protein n=1 Tax=Chlorobaculum sp. 24CR TaxID=2508878 RepID=UPI00100A346E|nr:hypothetical protein [Chlorobaculum sp. 24CR]RXK88713.1 hypothetical protein EST62_02350 [Chlorobaculum sp. 24CR]
MPEKIWNIVSYVLIPLVFGYVVSMLVGFQFGIYNNIFHLPYILKLSELPEFRNDAFYATLNNFTSIVLPIMRAFTTEENVRQVFYFVSLASKIAGFAGLVYLSRAAGFRKPVELLLAMTVLALTPLLQGSSIIGDHDMFVPFFTQTELTWVFVFLSVGLLCKDRIALAYAMVGIAFSINAFVGIWLLVMNTVALLLVKRPLSVKAFLKAAGGFLLFALPVALWIYFIVNGKHQKVDFSYIDYIRTYCKVHFLLESVDRMLVLKHFMLVGSGLLASRHLPNSRFWIAIQLGALLLLLVGIPLPYLVNNRFVFNLHLIRAAGLGQALATVVIVLAGVRLLLNKEELAMRTIGAVVLLSLALLPVRLIGMIVLLASMLLALPGDGVVTRFDRSGIFRWVRAWRRPLAFVCLALCVLALFSPIPPYPFILIQAGKLAVILGVSALLAFGRYRHVSVGGPVALLLLCFMVAMSCYKDIFEEKLYANRKYPVRRSWTEMVSWIRNSSLHGPFLLPLDDIDHTDYFQLQARRKVWVSWRQGGAVMWYPSFYRQWSTRFREVSALHTPKEMVAYAKAHGIRYLLLHDPKASVPISCELLKRTPCYVLYEVR